MALRCGGGFAIVRGRMQKLFQLVAALLLGACCAGAMVADRYAAQVSSRVITVGDVLAAMVGMR